MPRSPRLFGGTPASFLLTFALLALFGCGGVSKTASVNPTPTPMPTASPTPTGSPTPTPTPVPADAFLATMYPTVGRSFPPRGQITVDTAANTGAGRIEIDGLPLTAAGAMQFCPYAQPNGCFAVPFTAATGGSSFQFPRQGAFAGTFHVSDQGQVYVSGFGTPASVNFHSALLPVSTITGGVGETPGTAPLAGGTVTITGSIIHIVLNGTSANDAFSVSFCDAFGPSSCTVIGHFTSGADGNGTTDVSQGAPVTFGFIMLRDGAGAEFISAFRVM
ncbi:MAG TPA: hypothetical protein VHW72_08730 [Candidatus Angelobacter sp.]|nr:hypothetical protein [Candidatus Angelobacter sp.]